MMMHMELFVPKSIHDCEEGIIQLRPVDCDEQFIDDELTKKYGESDAVILEIEATHYNNDRSERGNKYLKNLASTKAFLEIAQRVIYIEFRNLYFDEWGPLFTTLQQCGANIEILKISGFSSHFTERGALLLGDILKNSRPTSCNNENNNNNQNAAIEKGTMTGDSFCIKELTLSSLRGSTAWIDGFLLNRSVTHLKLYYMPMLCRAIQFIQTSPHLKDANLFDAKSEEEGTIGTDFEKDVPDREEVLDLETLRITFRRNEEFPMRLCQGIGRVLSRAANLKKLMLAHVKENLPHDFLRDAIHCNTLILDNSDFDPHAVSSLIQREDDGKLKELHLYHPKDISKVETLLELVDLTVLDSFKIICNELIHPLYNQIAENKGPKRLEVDFYFGDVDKFATCMASCIVGNNKIQHLEIHTWDIRHDLALQLVKAMGTMPRLQSWVVHLSGRNVQLNIEEWKEWIMRQLQSNWNIQEIYLPYFELGTDIEEMLLFNKQWRKLLYCQEEFSSGIWALSLSRIKTVGMMFRVIKEVPSLFQEVADVASGQDIHRLLSFAVPHHPNCPGCACNQRRHQS